VVDRCCAAIRQTLKDDIVGYVSLEISKAIADVVSQQRDSRRVAPKLLESLLGLRIKV
jgi:hypothetical protein